MTTSDPRNLATTYFTRWKTGDFEALRAILADDVTFRGVLGTTDGIEETIAGPAGHGPSRL